MNPQLQQRDQCHTSEHPLGSPSQPIDTGTTCCSSPWRRMGDSVLKSDWFWDWRAEKYDAQVQNDPLIAKAAKRVSKFLKADDMVLDYGCGTGVVAFRIAGEVKQVLGIDASAKMVELAEERADRQKTVNVQFAQKTLFDQGLREDSFDVLVAFNILHLLGDPEMAVRRSLDLIKPGGLLISLTPCAGESGGVIRTLLSLIRTFKVLSHLTAFKVDEIKDLVIRQGFDLVESDVHECKIPSSFIVARKADARPSLAEKGNGTRL